MEHKLSPVSLIRRSTGRTAFAAVCSCGERWEHALEGQLMHAIRTHMNPSPNPAAEAAEYNTDPPAATEPAPESAVGTPVFEPAAETGQTEPAPQSAEMEPDVATEPSQPAETPTAEPEPAPVPAPETAETASADNA